MMRTISILGVVMLVAASRAETPKNDLAPLVRAPDLSPLLSPEEVAQQFAPWADQVRKSSAGWTANMQAMLAGAREALAPKIPRVAKLTLYSLFPFATPNIRANAPERADALEKLPRFHDYPVFGQVTITDANEANRWVDFIRDQILPGGFSGCDPMPRHGFRLATSEGEVDILMCYQCDQLAIFGAGELDYKYNPVLSAATMAQLNQLFDKQKIERDSPKKPGRKP